MSSNSTFKQRRKLFDSKQSELLRYAAATLGSGNLREAVKLPQGEDPHEWIAVNIVDFFNQISMLYGTISEHCTSESCPKMCAGPKYEYLWSDGRKAVPCAAPVYVDYLMTWVHDQLDDEIIFPSQIEQLKAIEHLNTSFKHFMLFVHEFNLIEAKQLAPLQQFIDRLAPERDSTPAY